MKAILRSEAAYDAPGLEVARPELEIVQDLPVLQRQRARKHSTPPDQIRSIIVFRLAVTIFFLALLIAADRRFAVLFDDELAALVVIFTVTITVVAMVKPVFTPQRRR